ncbi:MAG: transketolase [Victivallaceae bacterium]|nr:transketolase [Victivallaceae bacterium]
MDAHQLSRQAANTIRALAADAIQKAKSGHPGLPLGVADFAFTLFYKYLRHNPANPEWFGRDYFILSAGHGSMLQYALLHLFNYGVTIDDLKNFRQWGSKTPGHPEYRQTPGVEITTGPLGSGFASAVGMAMARKHFNASAGLDKSPLFNNRFFVICGDGCLMEGGTYEAASLAGHLALDNLICFYDQNDITIEGSAKLAFSEDVERRFNACNWRVIKVDDANNADKCDDALAQAVKSDGRPTLIVGKTTIGFGAPNAAGKSSCHGAPLGEDEVAALKRNLGISPESFFVPPEVSDFCAKRCAELERDAAKWDADYRALLDSTPGLAEKIESFINPKMPENLEEELLKAAPVGQKVATRVAGSAVLQRAAELLPSIFGGAADVGSSTGTILKKADDFASGNYAGRNIHFGIRELAMGLAANGMALSGTAIPYTSTFFVFCDYMKPAIRLAALMQLHEIYVFTHDSFHVGEDGATHQPVEHAEMLRTIPGMTVIRPADAAETAQAWAVALRRKTPTALLLTRQGLDPLPDGAAAAGAVAKGAYLVSDEDGFEYIIIASGSEVSAALKTAALLRETGKKVRVVSMPSQELFLEQPEAYRSAILPNGKKRVTIEAGSTSSWRKFVNLNDLCIGIDHFGVSAPAGVLTEKFGFTPEALADRICEHFK